MYTVTSSVPNGAERARGSQCRSQESDLLAQFPLCCRVWRLAAPDTTTGQVPPGSIRATYQQESGSDIDRYRDALMPRMRKSPPDTGKRETDPESCRRGREVMRAELA